MYNIGTKLLHVESGITGIVIPNFKLPDDICVCWQNGLIASYDKELLGEITILYEESWITGQPAKPGIYIIQNDRDQIEVVEIIKMIDVQELKMICLGCAEKYSLDCIKYYMLIPCPKRKI